eukprot:CAMPEP_0181403662 /NCGR_PEP_ID=MMETSP1110-20121109/3831_1 /TAXON_ID=174948 /ORGANISM="Symbiodinium sp., Strain CCMP421" /LENGTH=52 /DNA_ID=CAMNT_0023525969 /DNA_START=550 /DNA_END=708 /DNA_ORIENTATION=+
MVEGTVPTRMARLYGLACCTRCSPLVLRARCGAKRHRTEGARRIQESRSSLP